MSLGLPDWPEEGYVVIATVKKIQSYGAYVGLDEYDGKEGLLHISEISSRWVRNIRNHVRQNQKVVLQVLRTDEVKKQIDLSLRRISQDDKRKKLEQWKKARKAETLLRQVANQFDMELAELFQQEGRKLLDHYDSLYNALVAASKKGSEALTVAGVSDEIAEVLSQIAKEKIVIKGVTIQGIVELTSLNNDGVEDIRMTFIDADEVANELDASLKITTKGAPKYRLELTAEDYKKAEIALDETVAHIEDAWEEIDGSFNYTRE